MLLLKEMSILNSSLIYYIIFFINIFFLVNLHNESYENYLKPDFLKIPIKTINAAIDLIGSTDQRYPDVLVAKRLKLSHKVREISQYYVSVCNVLTEFNSFESTTIFFQITLQTLYIISNIFNLIKSAHLRDNVSSKPNYLALQCVWFVYNILTMFILVEPCFRTEREIAETRILVGKLMCHVTSETDPLKDETEAFYTHILLNEVSYTALGICTLERSLISKVIGSVTTILVIIF